MRPHKGSEKTSNTVIGKGINLIPSMSRFYKTIFRGQKLLTSSLFGTFRESISIDTFKRKFKTDIFKKAFCTT